MTRQDRLTTPLSCCLERCSGACWAWHRRKTPLQMSQTTPHACRIHPNVAKGMPTTSHSLGPQHISHPSISGTRAAGILLPPKMPIQCISTQYPTVPTQGSHQAHTDTAKKKAADAGSVNVETGQRCGRHASEHNIRVLLVKYSVCLCIESRNLDWLDALPAHTDTTLKKAADARQRQGRGVVDMPRSIIFVCLSMHRVTQS